jgi:hypothetical protein
MTGEETEKKELKPAQETGGTTAKGEAGKKRSGLRWILYAVAVIIVILAAAYLTIGVVISEAPPASSYPYTTTYFVSLPNSEKVTIGNTEIIAIPSEDGSRVSLSINKEPKEIEKGETKTIQERRAVITALAIQVTDFDFRVDATYLGQSGTTSQFYLAFKTSRQVPSFLIARLLPPSVQARPV